MFNYFKRRKAQKACDAFNAKNDIGTRVIIMGSRHRWDSRNMLVDDFTVASALVDNCQAVVGLVGRPDLYPLEGLCVMPKRVQSPYSAAVPLPSSYKRREDRSDDAPALTPNPGFEPSTTGWTTRVADPEPAIVSGRGGDFGGGGATSSWSYGGSSASSSGSSYGGNDSSSSSSSDSGSSDSGSSSSSSD